MVATPRKNAPKYPLVISPSKKVVYQYPQALRKVGDAVTIKIGGVKTSINKPDAYFPFTFLSGRTSDGVGLPRAFMVAVNGSTYPGPSWDFNGRFFNDVTFPNSPDNGGQFERVIFPESCKKLGVRDIICFRLRVAVCNPQMPIAMQTELSIWKDKDPLIVKHNLLYWSWMPVDPNIGLVVGNVEAVVSPKNMTYPIRSPLQATIHSVDFDIA